MEDNLLKDMDGMFEGYQLDSIIIRNVEYKILLDEPVQTDLINGLITLDSIECSLLNIPSEVFSDFERKDFLIDCHETNMRLILSKKDKVLEVLIAKKSHAFKIY